MTEMVEVMIDSVRVSLTNQQRIVMLCELDRERYLPIWIGPFEAEAITISLQEIEVARPQTHDLLIQSLEKLNARIIRVEVVALKGDVFYGSLVIELNGQVYQVDARPSDSIALAVRAHVPILVNSAILKEAGIIPEADIQANILDDVDVDTEDRSTSGEVEPEETKKRLSVFEDFLQNVDLDDMTDTDSDVEDEDEDEDEAASDDDEGGVQAGS